MTKAKNSISPVKNQKSPANCSGAGWAFSVTALLEHQFSMNWQENHIVSTDAWPWKTDVSSNFMTFSEQYLIDCTKNVAITCKKDSTAYTNKGCTSGNECAAIQYMSLEGLSKNSAFTLQRTKGYAYTGVDTGSCSYDYSNADKGTYMYVKEYT